ncbi:baeRF2 domain-containing protein [Nocardia nova]|uniref:baeRF2 domain-containing protein n=1 Tax=Nocardia nova TaxID=37330 RepID=UPI0033E26BD3
MSDELRELLDHEGPFASVYLGALDGAIDTVGQRSTAVCDALAEQGATPTLIDAVAEGLEQPGPPRAGQAVIADPAGLRVRAALPAPPDSMQIRLSALPYVLPLLWLRPPATPYAVAVVDSAGARLESVDAHGEHDKREIAADPPGRHGGRSQRSRRRRADAASERTAAWVTGELARMADACGAELIVVAGEDGARAALAEIFTADPRPLVTLEGFTRAAGLDSGELHRQIGRILLDRDHTRRTARVAALTSDCEHGRAVQGLPATTRALREHDLDTLLIDPGELGDRTVRVGATPSQVMPVDRVPGPPMLRRADEALPLAALAADAGIVTVEPQHALADGVGGLLRHRSAHGA